MSFRKSVSGMLSGRQLEGVQLGHTEAQTLVFRGPSKRLERTTFPPGRGHGSGLSYPHSRGSLESAAWSGTRAHGISCAGLPGHESCLSPPRVSPRGIRELPDPESHGPQPPSPGALTVDGVEDELLYGECHSWREGQVVVVFHGLKIDDVAVLQSHGNQRLHTQSGAPATFSPGLGPSRDVCVQRHYCMLSFPSTLGTMSTQPSTLSRNQ